MILVSIETLLQKRNIKYKTILGDNIKVIVIVIVVIVFARVENV